MLMIDLCSLDMTTTALSILPDQRSYPPSAPSQCIMAQTYYLKAPDFAMLKHHLHTYSQGDCPSPITSSAPSSVPASPDLEEASEDHLPPTPATLSSLSLGVSDESDDEIILPSYDSNQLVESDVVRSADTSSQDVDQSPTGPQRLHPYTPAADDISVEEEPSRHVDYLSHEWREEDIWTSWRYVVGHRDVYSNGARLENASWRTWAKLKHRLGTVSPETLNWLKDCDVTWLYGPLKLCNKLAKTSPGVSPLPSCLETPNLYLDRKPILKKRTASETILQRSLSQHTLLQHAGAILKAQEAGSYRSWTSFPRPELGPGLSSLSADSTLVSQAPTTLSSGTVSPCERRRIHFNNEVVQYIAVEAKDVDEEDGDWPAYKEDDLSSDDGILMLGRTSPQESINNRNTPRGSLSSENKIIAPLPPTTLKYRADTPEPPSSSMMSRWSGYFSKPTVPSTPSAPPEPSANFLLDGWDDDHPDLNWRSSQPQPVRDGSRPWFLNPEDEEELDRPLPSSSPSVCAAYDEGDSANAGILNRVIDTVNTARDIAHVIWNVGWRR